MTGDGQGAGARPGQDPTVSTVHPARKRRRSPPPRWPTRSRRWPRCGADRLVLALDGRPGPWLPEGFEVVAQAEGTFADRLDAAWAGSADRACRSGWTRPRSPPRCSTPAWPGSWTPASMRCWVRPSMAAGGPSGCTGTTRRLFDDIPMSTPGHGPSPGGPADRARPVRRPGCRPCATWTRWPTPRRWPRSARHRGRRPRSTGWPGRAVGAR